MNKIKISSNRNFGIVFFIFFLIISLWPLINNENIRMWSLFISLIFLILGIFNSKILEPLNKLWMKLGLLLGNIISPIIMAIIFFGIITPTSLFLKMLNKDILKLKKNRDNTYWTNKDNSNSDMKNQF